VALSGVKSPDNLCILLPDDVDDFTIRPVVEVDVAQILETIQSSRPLLISQISPGDNLEPSIASIDPSDATLSDEFPAATSTLPRMKFVVFPVSITMLLKHLIRTRLRYLSMFRLCHGSLRTNRCFGLIASEISLLKSLSGPSVPVATLLRRVL
jgi:hypothetical protein